MVGVNTPPDHLGLSTAKSVSGRYTTSRGIRSSMPNEGSRSIEYRRAVPDDAELILQLWGDSGASIETTDEVGYLRRAVGNPAVVLLLAVDQGQIVGSLMGAFDGWRGNMYRLVVRPSHRRRGIARELVRRVEQTFAEWDVRRVTGLVEVDRPWATSFWSAVGYPRDEHITRHVGTLGPSMLNT